MSRHVNTIKIKAGKLIINDPRKPLRVIVILSIVLLMIHAIYRGMEYQNSEEWYHLLIGGIFSFFAGILLSREFFFRTYKKEILTADVHRTRIKRIPLGGNMVLLKLKLGRKTREIFIDRQKAEEVRAFLDFLS